MTRALTDCMVQEYDVSANTLLLGLMNSDEDDILTIDRENREKLRLNITEEPDEHLVEALYESLK